MRRLLCFLCFLCSLLFNQAQASVTNVTALVTWTNVVKGVTNGDTITVNGEVRRYTNGTLNAASTWIQSTNIVGWAATNTFLHLSVYTPLGVSSIQVTNTNAVLITSTFATNTFLSVALSSGVGTVSYSTQVWADLRPLLDPNDALPTAVARTNNASGLIRLVNDNRATNQVANGNVGWTNILDLTSQQRASNKVFWATTNNGGLSDGRRITNFVSLSGSNGTVTGVRFYNPTNHTPVTYSLINYSNAIRSEGTGPNSLQIGSNAQAVGWNAIAIGNNAVADNGAVPNTSSMAIGNGAAASNQLASALGNNAVAMSISSLSVGDSAIASAQSASAVGQASAAAGTDSTALGAGAAASTARSVAIGKSAVTAIGANAISLGYTATATNTGAIAIGAAAVSSNANTVVLGTASYRTHVPGFAEFEGGITNLVTPVGSTNRFPAGADISFGRSTVTTVASGHNTINVGTNVFVDLTGSPSAAWTWGGITGGNRDGKFLIVRNNTGWPTDILHNSGTEPTAALRISTPTTTNITLNTLGSATFIYDANASRWVLLDVFNTATPAASATNALSSLSTNGVQVTAALTNLNVINDDTSSQAIDTTNSSGNVSMRIINKPLFVITNDVRITNVTGPVSIISNLNGSASLPANFWKPGKVVEMEFFGRYFSGATVANSNEVFFGGTLLATNTMPYVSTVTADPWHSRIQISCLKDGASGILFCQGALEIPSTAGGVSTVAKPIRLVSSYQVAIDTTAAGALDYKFNPGATPLALWVHTGIARVVP